MRQLANQAPASRRVAPLAAGAALLALLALLALSSAAQAVGGSVQAGKADVLEGEKFDVQVSWGVGDTSEQVQVHCAHCGAGWSATLTKPDAGSTAGQRTSTLTFPDDFRGAQGEPRWAEPYTVSLAGEPLALANVTVHLVDDFLQPGPYMVTDAVHIQSAGWAAATGTGGAGLLNVTISKWTHTGSLVQVAALHLLPSQGIASYDWRLPKELASDMDCPGIGGRCRNLTLRVEGPGKAEVAVVEAQPAVLDASLVYLTEAPDGVVPLLNGTVVYNRSATVQVGLDVRYLNGAALQPKDRTLAGNRTLNGTLRLAVEQLTGPGSNPVATPVATLYATSTPRGWRASWLIPRNVTTTATGADTPLYRVRLPAQQDAYDNWLADTNGTAFRVLPLRIQPVLVRSAGSEVERLTNATATWHLEYLDHEPFTNQSNSSTMRAVLVDAASNSQVDQVPLQHAGGGNWTATFSPGIAYKPLGTFLLRLLSASDADGNQVNQADAPAFQLVPARPRITLATIVDGAPRNDTRGFDRGDTVTVHAEVRYADGRPFTRARLPPGVQAAIVANVTRLDADGNDHGTVQVGLAPDDDEGHWTGALVLKDLDGTDPIGPWRWGFDVKDRENPPNGNATAFTRWVHGAPIRVGITRQPETLLRPGDAATMEFQASVGADGPAIDGERAAGGIAVLVRAWENGTAGAPIARVLPQYDPDRGVWTAVWTTNRSAWVGEYVLTVTGQDAYGNVVQDTDGRHVSVVIDRQQRQVLREPPVEVHRGEVVLVLFDGMDGDTGQDGDARPRIEVQKWNPVRNAWEKELGDVRIDAGDGSPDDLGRFATGPSTDLGLYRLALYARNDQRADIVAYSRSFRVLPVEVQRDWLPTARNATAQPVAKGTQLVLQAKREDGDLVEQAAILRGGDFVGNATPVLKVGRFDVLWSTPFTLPDGAYSVVLHGRDIHNNTFSTPPLGVNLTGVALRAKLPSPPAEALQRADRLDLRALLQYPDETNVHTGNFTARFVLGNLTVGQAPVGLNRSGWLLSWTPPADAPLGRYAVLLDGTDGLGNALDGRELFHFELGEGVLHRGFSAQRSVANRTDTVVWRLPASPDDQGMEFTLVDDTGGRQALASTLTPDGEYEVVWHPAKDERMVRYVLQASGADGAHNAVLAESRGLVLRPAPVGVRFLAQPGREVNPGEPARWTFQLVYADGTPLPVDDANKPQVAMLSGSTVADPKPELGVEGAKWVVTWTPVEGKNSGVYQLAIGGRDQYLNEVQLNFGQNVRIHESAIKQFLGVPGFEAALGPLALLGAALALRRRA